MVLLRTVIFMINSHFLPSAQIPDKASKMIKKTKFMNPLERTQ